MTGQQDSGAARASLAEPDGAGDGAPAASDGLRDLLRAAALAFDVPWGMMLLKEGHRYLVATAFPRAEVAATAAAPAFLAAASSHDDVLETYDIGRDPRFSEPSEAGDAAPARFFAGAAVTRNGRRLGALCVFGREPKVLSEAQRETLRALARVAGTLVGDGTPPHAPAPEASSLANRASPRPETGPERAALPDTRHAGDGIYRAIVEALPDSINAKDVDGRFIAANASTARLMVAASTDDLIGKTDFDFYSEEMAQEFRRQEHIVLGNVAVGPLEEQVTAPDGSKRWLATVKAPLKTACGEVFGIITRNQDITDRKRLERELDIAKLNLEAAVGHMADGLVLFDRDGAIQFCNEQYRTLFPLTADLRVKGGRLSEIIAASIERGEEVPSADSAALVAGRVAFMRRPGRRVIELREGRILEARTRDMPDGATLITLADITELRRNESEARETNRLLMMAEEIAHVGHWRFDVRNAKLSWSDEVFRIHGLEPAAVCPGIETAIGFYHPDDRAEVERHVSTAISERKNYEFTLRLIRPTGDLRHVLARGHCELDPVSNQVTGLFGVFLDLTEVISVQLALRQASADLNATLDSMDRGLVRVSKEGSVDLVNKRFFELLAFPRTLFESQGPRFATLEARMTSRGDRYRSRAFLDPSEQTNGVNSVLDCAHGRVLEVRVEPLPGGAELRTYSDITARLEAKRALQDSEALYRMLADATSDVITQLNLDLTRRYVSPACRSVLGYEPGEMLALPPAKLMHPQDFVGVEAVMRRVIAGHCADDRVTATYRLRHKAGHWVWVEAAISLVRRSEDGLPDSLLLSIRDITERRRAARHLEHAKAAAENVARLKSEFVANMSHELRTPLTGILGIHDLLAENPALGPDLRRQVKMARDAGRSLLGIVNDILDFSKIEAGHLAIEQVPIDVVDLVEACRSLGEEAGRGKSVAVVAELNHVPDRLVGDPTRMRQVLLNLVTNAVKFTNQGRVEIRATYDGADARLHVAVVDTGIGIAPEHIPALFARFSQADASITRQYGGTGLGLAISKRLIDLMGGEIGVTSEVGRGSTFRFSVPLAAPRPVAGPVSTEPTAGGRSLTILLAEDNEVNQEIIRSMLEARGHSVRLAANGLVALQTLREMPTVDVVLMDLQMPVMDGLSAARAIREENKHVDRPAIPIIGLTANAMTEDVQRCLEAGMQAHVAKPIEWDVLFATIDRVRAIAPRSRPAPAVAAASDVLEKATLDHLVRVVGASRVAAMLAMFAHDVKAFRQQIDDMGPAELRMRLHQIKSSAGQLGFRPLSELAGTFEAALGRGGEAARGGEEEAAVPPALGAVLDRSIAEAHRWSANIATALPDAVRIPS